MGNALSATVRAGENLTCKTLLMCIVVRSTWTDLLQYNLSLLWQLGRQSIRCSQWQPETEQFCQTQLQEHFSRFLHSRWEPHKQSCQPEDIVRDQLSALHLQPNPAPHQLYPIPYEHGVVPRSQLLRALSEQ